MIAADQPVGRKPSEPAERDMSMSASILERDEFIPGMPIDDDILIHQGDLEYPAFFQRAEFLDRIPMVLR